MLVGGNGLLGNGFVGWFCSVFQDYKTRTNPHNYNPLVNITNVFNKMQTITNYFQKFPAIAFA